MGTDSVSGRHDADCPLGQVFFTCEATSFRGCCSSDPCAWSQCLDNKLSVDSPNINLNEPREKVGPLPSESEITLWPPPDEPTSTTSSTSSSSSSSTMTDSGITHTIPNDEIVTVTKHTLITTGERPSPTEEPPSLTESVTSQGTGGERDFPTPTGPPPTATGMPNGVGNNAASISTGAIVGMALGGLALIIASLVLFFTLKRRRKNAQKSGTAAGAYSGTVGEDLYDDKHFPPSVSPHTTGTKEAADPFAPFGGRADDPNRPRLGAVEMDATSTAPVELPAMSAQTENTSTRSTPALNRETVGTVRQTPSRDPRATLNALRSENGKPAYVNHWDQYRAMGGS